MGPNSRSTTAGCSTDPRRCRRRALPCGNAQARSKSARNLRRGAPFQNRRATYVGAPRFRGQAATGSGCYFWRNGATRTLPVVEPGRSVSTLLRFVCSLGVSGGRRLPSGAVRNARDFRHSSPVVRACVRIALPRLERTAWQRARLANAGFVPVAPSLITTHLTVPHRTVVSSIPSMWQNLRLAVRV